MTTCLLFADQMRRFIASSKEIGNRAGTASVSVGSSESIDTSKRQSIGGEKDRERDRESTGSNGLGGDRRRIRVPTFDTNGDPIMVGPGLGSGGGDKSNPPTGDVEMSRNKKTIPSRIDIESKAAQERFIRRETGHPAFLLMLAKFEGTFYNQVELTINTVAIIYCFV